jgi:hypothetical protein
MQKWKLLVFVVFVVVLAGGTAFAAGPGNTNSSDAVLQVTGHSLIPPAVYPGTSGYVELNVANTGSIDATGITVYYTYSSSSSQLFLSAGDISGNSNEQITVPFQVPQQVPGGIYLIDIDVYYTAYGSTSQKKTSVSIPVIVSQYEPLEITTMGTNREVIAPGEAFQLQLLVNNTGGVVNNLIVTTPANSSFSLEGETQKTIGNILSGTSKNVTLNLISSSTAAIGQYTLPLIFTYQDASGNTTEQTLYVGPVSILDSSTQFRLSMVPLTPTEVGSQAVFQLTVENVGTNPLSAIVDINNTNAFTPIGTSRVYFDPIASGKSASANVTLGISSSISAGYYELPLSISLSSGNVVTQNVGVPVTATPDLTVTATSQSGVVTVQISNTGNAPIRSVYVSASSNDFAIAGGSDKFVGTLNVDDFATISLTVGAQRPGASNHTIIVTTSFKDSNNIPHVITKNIDVTASSSNFTSTTFGARRSSGVIFGLDWTEIIGGIVVIVIAYFAYRHFRKRGAKA